MMKPEAVIFDYGKVLSIPQQPSDIEAMARDLMYELQAQH